MTSDIITSDSFVPRHSSSANTQFLLTKLILPGVHFTDHLRTTVSRAQTQRAAAIQRATPAVSSRNCRPSATSLERDSLHALLGELVPVKGLYRLRRLVIFVIVRALSVEQSRWIHDSSRRTDLATDRNRRSPEHAPHRRAGDSGALLLGIMLLEALVGGNDPDRPLLDDTQEMDQVVR